MSPEKALRHGQRFPYDAPDAWWHGDTEPPLPQDWAVAAARGVLADLTDRHTIKHGFNRIDEAIRAEIVEKLAAIIRQAQFEYTR